MKLHTIIPERLYQSARFAHVVNKVEMLQSYGITIVANLWQPDPDLLTVEGLHYLHLPIPDGKRLDPEPVHDLANRLAAAIRGDAVVLSHCYGGKNRSGLLSALTVRQLYGCTGSEALAIVRIGRPRAVTNAVFVEHLHGLAKP